MICAKCATVHNMLPNPPEYYGTCSWCGQLGPCFERAVAQQTDPRRSIVDRIKQIKARQAELRGAVEEYHALCIERLTLQERHDKLEHLLTKVPIKKYSVEEVNKERAAIDQQKEATRLLKTLSKEQLAAMIAELTGGENE